MAKEMMTDAQLRRRRKLQGEIGRTTSTLGLAGAGLAAGGLVVAKKPGALKALQKVPKVGPKLGATPHEASTKMKNAALYTGIASGGIGGVGGFNAASIYSDEARRKKQTTLKKGLDMDTHLEMGYYGEEGHPVKLPEIKVPIEKAWSPTAGNFDSEAKRQKRAKVYEGGALVGAGGGAVATGLAGRSLHQSAKNIPKEKMAPFGDKGMPKPSQARMVTDVKALKGLKKPAGKLGAAVAVTGGSIAAHGALKRKQKGSWQPYAKGAVSAWGIDHTLDNPDPI